MRPPLDSGLTLIEMLVVLAIIGVVAGAVVLGVGAAGRSPKLDVEANRLAERTRLALDETLVTGQPLALAWDTEGYGFRAWDGAAGRWTPASTAELTGRRDLPSGIRLEAREARVLSLQGGRPFALQMRLGDDTRSVASDGLNVTVAAR